MGFRSNILKTFMASEVVFTSYISSPSQIMAELATPLSGQFIRWANSFVVDKETKISITVALIRTSDGRIWLGIPLASQLQ